MRSKPSSSTTNNFPNYTNYTIAMLFNACLAVAASVAAVSASPVKPRAESVALPVSKVSTFTSIKNIVSKGQAKISKINTSSSEGNRLVSSGPATNEDVSYVASVTIGGSAYSLIVDTGCEYSLLRIVDMKLTKSLASVQHLVRCSRRL